jgi:N-acetylglucosaminyl-diphospho-decaprenol L-rhamnosyltransferase
MQHPDVSILIVSYNVCDLLAACLRSVKEKTTGVSYEVIVVDSASTDETVDMVREKFPWVKLIACDDNVGFPKGNNIAYAASTGRFIFMLNPDTELVTDVAMQLKHFIGTHDGCGLVGPRMLNTDGSLQRSVQRFITVDEIVAEVFFLHRYLLQKRSYLHQPVDQSIEVEALSGAAMMCKRSLIEQIGFLDEALFWTEDMDFCFRAHKAGYHNFYLPEAVLVHHVGQSGKKNQNVMVSRQVLTKINFFRKHGTATQLATVKAARFAHVVSRLAALAVAAPLGKRYRDKFEAYRHTFGQFIKHRY